MRQAALGNCAAVAVLAWLAVACGATDGPRTGGQTNWLRACESDAQCGSGLTCLCGACTKVCEASDASCAALPGASCVTADDSGAIAVCGGALPPVAGLCLPRCGADECARGTACIAGVCAPLGEPSVVVAVDSAVRHQTLVGLGAGIAYLSDEIAQHPAQAALFDTMFAESGFDMLRLMNRYGEGDGSELASAVEIVNAATARNGAPPTLLLSSSSPPAALKASGSAVCSGNPDTCTLATLADGTFDYAGFATHWRASLDAYAAAGLTPDYISIQNDPDWVPPAASSINACRFLPAEGTATVTVNGAEVEVEYPGYNEALATVLGALADLPSRPQIAAPETVGVESTVTFASELDLTSVGAVAHHMYGTDPFALNRDALLALNDFGAQHGLPIFQTEMQGEGLETAILVHGALETIGASVYLQNDYASSAYLLTENPNALIALGETDYTVQDPYHALRHYAHDTAPGWVRVGATADAASVLVTAWLSPTEDALTVVLVNPESASVVAALPLGAVLSSSRVTRTVFTGIERSAELGELPAGGIITLPGQSVVTVAVQW